MTVEVVMEVIVVCVCVCACMCVCAAVIMYRVITNTGALRDIKLSLSTFRFHGLGVFFFSLSLFNEGSDYLSLLSFA